LKLSMKYLLLGAAFLLAAAVLPVLAQDPAPTPEEQVRAVMDQAKKAGAKGQLPHAWWQLDSGLDEASKKGATDQQWAALETEARHLLNAATFIEEMRRQKSGMEALLGRFDQALAEIATLYGVELNPVYSGTNLAGDLIEKLNHENLQRQVLIDSLTVANRGFTETVGGRVAAQESLITALQVEVSSLRRQLWETELRVGVAEADRSAAETVLTQKQQREAALVAIRTSFSPEDGEILIRPGGEVVLRVYGISFGVGSSSLNSGQDALVGKIVAAIEMFPRAEVMVEGHTDDTGSYDANLRLSRRRAETVARLLETELGRPEDSIATEGFGPDRPVALNSTPEGRALNRRIDVVIRESE